MSGNNKHDKRKNDRKGSGRSSTYPKPWSEWRWNEEFQDSYKQRETSKGVFKTRWKEQSSDSTSISKTQDGHDTNEAAAGLSRMKITETAPADDESSDEYVATAETITNIPPSHAVVRTKDTTSIVESFDPNYRVHDQWEFKWGRVFKVLWSEPIGAEKEEGGTVTTRRVGTQGKETHEKVRRFVIIDNRHDGHCICLPIMSYLNKGTKKQGLNAKDHAIIYTTHHPQLLKGEPAIRLASIKVKPSRPEHKLSTSSRLNYAKVYTVECNVKVWFIGNIHKDSEWQLGADYNAVHPPIPVRGKPPPQVQLSQQSFNTSANSTHNQLAHASLYTSNTNQQPYGSDSSGWPRQVPLPAAVPGVGGVQMSTWAQPTTSPWIQQPSGSQYPSPGNTSQQPSYFSSPATQYNQQPIQYTNSANYTGGQFDSSAYEPSQYEEEDIYSGN